MPLKVSFILPSRNETFLPQTIHEILSKCVGEVEVIAILDGYWPKPPLEEVPGLTQLHWKEGKGMRAGINAAASIARGEYLCKLDAHCMIAPGFDDVLKADCDDDWIVIPTRRSLHAETWTIIDKAPVEAMYLCWPWHNPDVPGLHGEIWKARAKTQAALIDDEMSFQGSCWFMKKDYFWKFGGMQEEGYGEFVQEAQQLGNRAWLSGGRVVRNKKTWYAHLHKGKKWGRGYFISKQKMIEGTNWSMHYWMKNQWPERIHDLEWLIDKFHPVPTWPEDWKTQENEYPPIHS